MKFINFIKNLFNLDDLIERDLSAHRQHSTKYEDLCK